MLEFFKKLFYPITAVLNSIQTYLKSLIFIVILILVFSTDTTEGLQKPNLVKISLSGPILKSDQILEKIEKAKTDSQIKGVLFIVDSPGGAVAPSVEIAYAIKELKQKKPVIAYAGGIMASGSYYASIWADKIIANPGSMIGSIGVIFQGANIEELISKLGIKTQTVKVGKYKEAGTPTRKWTNYEKEELNKVINDTYESFVNDVSLARGLDPKDHTKFADAHIFTAKQAKNAGLVDKVATISIAKSELIKLSGVKDPVWEKEDKLEKFMDKLIQESVNKFSLYFSSSLKAQFQ